MQLIDHIMQIPSERVLHIFAKDQPTNETCKCKYVVAYASMFHLFPHALGPAGCGGVPRGRPPNPKWGTAAAVEPGAVCEAWETGLPESQWATAVAVGPGAGRGERGGHGIGERWGYT